MAIFRSLIRRLSDICRVATVNKQTNEHTQYIPRTVATRVASPAKFANDKKAKVEAAITFEGLEGSQLESVLPLVYQHFDLVGLRLTLHKHLISTLQYKGKFNIQCRAETELEHYDESEIEYLRPLAEQYGKTAIVDPDKEPKNFKNLTSKSRVIYEYE